jgi:hypothetical protein
MPSPSTPFIKETNIMFQLLTLTAQVLLNLHKITDKASWQVFLNEIVALVKARAAETKIRLDETELKHIEFTLNNDGLFEQVYRLIDEQCQTDEILFESADEDTLLEMVEETTANNPEAIDPIVIVSLVSQIISIINIIKANRNR